MNVLGTVCLLICIIGLVSANNVRGHVHRNSNGNSIKDNIMPTDLLSVSQIVSLPSMNEITLEMLEGMSVEKGADMVNKMFHLAQVGQTIEPTYVPKTSEIPCYVVTHDNKKVTFKLNEISGVVTQQRDMGDDEVTVYITGLPQKTESVRKATRELVEAYMQRYNVQMTEPQNNQSEEVSKEKDSSEEDYTTSVMNRSMKSSGNLVVVEFGNVLHNMYDIVFLDVEQTGVEIGDVLTEWIVRSNVPQAVVHVIGSNIGAHIAGVVGRQFNRVTGYQLRRITGLDPSKIYAYHPNTLTGLSRGDAKFVDVIHTSAHGMGTVIRCGDVDFYPNGPSVGNPGVKNVVEATMRATRYYAESVVPGNERNFPAVCASSLKEYREHSNYGIRVHMGIDVDYDVKGDFMLQVNSKSPFSHRSSVAQKHNKTTTMSTGY